MGEPFNPQILLALLGVGVVTGALGPLIAGGRVSGCFGSIAIGAIGAAAGRFVALKLQYPTPWVIELDGQPFPLAWSLGTAAAFVIAVAVLTRGMRR